MCVCLSPLVIEVDHSSSDNQRGTVIGVRLERDLVETVRKPLSTEDIKGVARFVDGSSRAREELTHLMITHLKNVPTGTIACPVLVSVCWIARVQHGNRKRVGMQFNHA